MDSDSSSYDTSGDSGGYDSSSSDVPAESPFDTGSSDVPDAGADAPVEVPDDAVLETLESEPPAYLAAGLMDDSAGITDTIDLSATDQPVRRSGCMTTLVGLLGLAAVIALALLG